MARPVVLAALLLLVSFGPGCRTGDGRPQDEQSTTARALCEREAQTNEPQGGRGTLLGAYATTIKAVNPEIEREYKGQERDGRLPTLVSQPGNEPLALCYYDVPADQLQVQPEVERVGIVIDQRLNSFVLYSGRKSEVPVQPIG